MWLALLSFPCPIQHLLTDHTIQAWRPSTRGQINRHIQRIAETGRMGWQAETVYGRRSKGETARARYKGILGDRLHARTLPAPRAEAMVSVTALNRRLDAKRLVSVRTS